MELASVGRGACLGEGSHYRGILPGVCEHRTCDKRQSHKGESRPLVLWDARVVGERKLAEEGSLVFAAMSGSGFRSPKMSPMTVRVQPRPAHATQAGRARVTSFVFSCGSQVQCTSPGRASFINERNLEEQAVTVVHPRSGRGGAAERPP